MGVNKRVVPLAGTWIETSESERARMIMEVVPHAGTWIETRSYIM